MYIQFSNVRFRTGHSLTVNRRLIKKSSILLLIFFNALNLFAQAPEGPKLSQSRSYTWVLLPDPQTYQKFGRNQFIFSGIIDWIKDQKSKLNIQMVLCTGDLVEQNYILKPDSINGDQTSLEQWTSVSNAFHKLNNIIPYILCTGNHDYGIKSAETRYSQFNSYFSPQSNPLTYGLLVEMGINGQGVKTLENACYEWKSPLGQSFLIFSLEFSPRNEILNWAKQIASRARYKNHVAVVLTHSYLLDDGKRVITENYQIMGQDANDGESIWNKLIKHSPNIKFVFAGHIAASDEHKGQVGFSTDENASKGKVNQMLFNAQREGGGWHGNGGDGWLRILEFLPDKKTVKVYTFSPYFFLSPSSRNMSWRRENYDEFEMTY